MTPDIVATAALAALGLTIESVFIPFSQSRNKAEKRNSLNWKVSLCRNGKAFLTCDYSAGIAHCPGYKVKEAPLSFRTPNFTLPIGQVYKGTASRFRAATERERLNFYRESITAAECESGRAMRFRGWGGSADFQPIPTISLILPSALDVFHSVVMDSSVLDYATYAEWCAEFGYDIDSIKGESIYRLCLSHTLALRSAIGESGIDALKTAFEDY
jgi:hypothetical protein